MRWPWGSWKPASKSGEPEDEGQDPAADHHRHFHVEHGDVETESASSEHWPVLPVEEAVHVKDPAADRAQSCSAAEESMGSSSSSGSEDGYDDVAEARGGGRRPGRLRRRGRRRPQRGLPVRTFVGAAAAVLLVLVAVVASWRRRRQPAAGS